MGKKRRIGILTGGGDVQPLNCVINSVINASQKYTIELIGFMKGWQGILENEFVDLNSKAIDCSIGGTILKSSRVNLQSVQNGKKKVINNLSKLGIDGLIVIGGEDTLSNSLYINNIPQVLISKTIDNDVGIIEKNRIVNYFTLGYPTAAEKISSFVSINEGLRTTAYSHERIIVVESMGMHAGWLAFSSSMGHPDFIILPEYPLNYDLFVEKVISEYNKKRNLIVVIAEGARWEDGSYISADNNEKDDFGHPRFLGSASSLCQKLKIDLKKYFDTRNINSVNPSYLYRSGKPNDLDKKAAELLGEAAVNIFLDGIEDLTFIATKIADSELFIENIELGTLKDIEDLHRFVPETFYDKENFCITMEGREYLSQIIHSIPILNYKL